MEKLYGSDVWITSHSLLNFQEYGFVPKSFIIPEQLQEANEAIQKADARWILKPVGSSRHFE